MISTRTTWFLTALVFKLFSRFALFLKRRSYIQRLIGILLHLHRADFDTYAFLMPLFCFDSATCWILGVDSFFPLRLYILLSFSRAWLRSFMPCTGGFRASDNVNTGGVLGYGTVLFPQLLLAVFSRCSMEMNFVFFFSGKGSHIWAREAFQCMELKSCVLCQSRTSNLLQYHQSLQFTYKSVP